MIVLLGGVTNTDMVRAVLGVADSANELPDTYFTARKMESALRLELSSWLPASLESLQDAADAADEGAPEILVWDAVQQAAGYWCAWEISKSANIALFQSLEDGQNKVTRAPQKQELLLAQLAAGYQTYREQALASYTGSVSAAATSWIMGRSAPTFDPVIG